MSIKSWDAIDTVLLDMDGTLLDLHFDNYFWEHYVPERYAQIHGKAAADATELIKGMYARVYGSLDWYCMDYWSEQLNLDIDVLKREVAHKIAERPHTLDFLRALRRAGKRAVLITNAHRKSLAIKLEQTAIGEHLDRVICSHDHAAPKEEALFWQRLQQDEPFDSERTLFIDDTESVLRAAHDFGIKFLLTLKQPDSKKPLREAGHFPAIHHFDEIMPPAND